MPGNGYVLTALSNLPPKSHIVSRTRIPPEPANVYSV